MSARRNQEQEQLPPEDGRAPYEPPCVEHEEEFERLVLACCRFGDIAKALAQNESS